MCLNKLKFQKKVYGKKKVLLGQIKFLGLDGVAICCFETVSVFKKKLSIHMFTKVLKQSLILLRIYKSEKT